MDRGERAGCGRIRGRRPNEIARPGGRPRSFEVRASRSNSSRSNYRQRSMQVNGSPTAGAELSLRAALWIAGLCGFIALGFEILWFRVFVLASTDRAPMFALLLSTCLAGIAGGSFIAGRLTEKKSATEIAKVVGISMLTAGGVSAYLPPAVAWLKALNIEFLLAAPLFFVVSAMLGSVLPLLCELGVEADDLAGRGVSLVYVANIIGSTLGSLERVTCN